MRILYDNYDGYSYEDAKRDCIERHIEDYPNDIDYIPTDTEIGDEINFVDQITWENTEQELRRIFDSGDTFIMQGSCGTWSGRLVAGGVINNFNELCRAWNNCDYLKIYVDRYGRFNIESSHHDGTNYFIVKQLNDKGLNYYDKHGSNIYSDRQLFTSKYSKNIKIL